MTWLIDTETPVVLTPPLAAAQTSITDCGSCVLVLVSSAWQLVVDKPVDWSLPTEAGSTMVTGPRLAGTLGALVITRLFVIVTCSV